MIKQVIVIRRDLKMRRGKEIAQGAHASVSFLVKLIRCGFSGYLLATAIFAFLCLAFLAVRAPDYVTQIIVFFLTVICGLLFIELSCRIAMTAVQYAWINGTFSKICCRVNSEEELMEIYSKAIQAGLNCDLITDSGATEFHGVPTKTCLAIGPDESEKIDLVTGHLELY